MFLWRYRPSACNDSTTSSWIGRRFGEAGHVLRIIPAQFVKRYLKFNQDDSLMPGRLPQKVEDADHA
jgi:hypothetical protein